MRGRETVRRGGRDDAPLCGCFAVDKIEFEFDGDDRLEAHRFQRRHRAGKRVARIGGCRRTVALEGFENDLRRRHIVPGGVRQRARDGEAGAIAVAFLPDKTRFEDVRAQHVERLDGAGKGTAVAISRRDFFGPQHLAARDAGGIGQEGLNLYYFGVGGEKIGRFLLRCARHRQTSALPHSADKASPKRETSLSTSACVVVGATRVMLWNGVTSTFRFRRKRWMARSTV